MLLVSHDLLLESKVLYFLLEANQYSNSSFLGQIIPFSLSPADNSV